MSDGIEVRVPDIGDFKEVPVIEVLVKPGDTIKPNDSVITLESEKASLEVPASSGGTVKELRIGVGDKVSEGSVILTLEPQAAEKREAQPPAQPPAQQGSSKELTVPDIGDFADVPIVEVLVKPGDRIEKGAPLVVIESEKASMEVPSTGAGTIESVAVKPGDKVSRGSVLATLREAGAATGDGAARTPAPARTATASSPSEKPAPTPVQQAAPAAQPSENGKVHASPSIRRFARELGVDLHRVVPTGPNGRVTREDVQGFVKTAVRDGVSSAGPAALSLPALPKVDFAAFGPIERKPLSRIKKISGPLLHRNWVTIPHVTQNDDADVTDLEAFRTELNAELKSSGVKVTMLAFLMKACVAALKAHPEFNASLDGDQLVYKKYYNIGFAADTPDGLLVPVLKSADTKGLREIAQETAQLAAKARDGKLSPSEMQGGTFTISSLGSIGGTYFTPIINAPEVAILGACRAAMRPVWNGETFEPRLMQPLSLSYDHRVIDGAAAARFTTYLARTLADLRRALL